MNWKALVQVACELPEVEEGTWYRMPALLVGGRGFVGLKEDGRSVVFLFESVEEQAQLTADSPGPLVASMNPSFTTGY